MLDFNDGPQPEAWKVSRATPDHDLNELSRKLAERASEWVPREFPNGRISQDKKEWRLANIKGDKPTKDGSCVITLKGEKAGCWYDHSDLDGGQPLSTLAHATGLRGRPLFERAAALVGAAKKNSASVQPVNGHEQRMRQVKAILADCVDAKGTLVETYLQARGVDLPPGCTDLLYHPDLTDWDARRGRPAMVAIIRDATGQVTGGIHRTYLADDGSAKADTSKAKMMLGPSAGVVQLMPIGEDGVLGVGEGIETSLAGAKIFGVPAWAALSAGNMRNFKFPKGLKQLIIFADRGEDGEKSAAFLLSRAKTASIDACIYLPNGGDDFADDLACSECRAEDYVPFWPDDQRPDSATDEHHSPLTARLSRPLCRSTH